MAPDSHPDITPDHTPDHKMISVEDVHSSYGSLQVLQGVSFDIGSREGVVLLGANGCGKSTLMRCLNGLEKVTSGQVRIDGTGIVGARSSDLRAVRRKMGYVFQQFNLVQQLSAFQNVLFGAMGHQRLGILGCLGPVASRADRERAMECLDRVGMADRARHKPTELSGGQQQRVAIARMLMQSPRVVIADEPIASLDPKAGREVLELLWRIVNDEGLTLLCTLHQLDLAAEFGDRIIGMKAGKVAVDSPVGQIAAGDLDDLYRGRTSVADTKNSAAPEEEAA